MKRILFVLFVLVCLPSQQLAHAQGSTPIQISFVKLSQGDLTLRGMYGAVTLWFPFESDWRLQQEIQIKSIYVASPLLNVKRSTLTVTANDTQISSTRVVADGAEHTFSFTVPAQYLQGKGVSLRFEGYLRLTDEECEETNNPGQWLTIRGTSEITVAPTLDTKAPSLTDLPQAIVVQNSYSSAPPVIFVLPDAPDNATLTTAAQVAARLGTSADAKSPYTVESASSLTDDEKQQSNLVLIGLPQTNSVIAELDLSAGIRGGGGTFSAPRQSTGKAGSSVISLYNSPWNPVRHVLIVSGADEAGLALSGQIFGTRQAFQALQGTSQTTEAIKLMADSVPGQPWKTDRTTFAQLGETDRKIIGAGISENYYSFRRPAGWVLDYGSQLTLYFAFSPNLRVEESYISVFVNEVNVGSIRTGNGIAQNQVTFDLPIDLLNQTADGQRPQTLNLRVEVSNHLNESSCTQTHNEAAWTQISAGSYFTTPHLYQTLPDLQAFPYPFVSDATNTPTVIILPVKPTAQDLANGLSLAATLGRFAPADFQLNVLTADTASKNDQANANLILLGDLQRNPLLKEFSQSMTVVPGLSDYESNSDSGLLREAPSPWNPAQTALLVYGNSTAAYQLAVDALYNAAPPVTQPGSVAVVEAQKTPAILYHSNNTAADPKPAQTVAEPVIPKPAPWMVVTGILLAATILVIAIVSISQRRGTGKGSK